MKHTHISWAHHTFNPWLGCTKVSRECRACYAADQDSRYQYTAKGWGLGKPRKKRDATAWKEPQRWNQEAEQLGVRYRVFCASMADVFDGEVPPEWRAELFQLIENTPCLDWLLLTKRPQLIRSQLKAIGYWKKMPMLNVWIGFSAGDQEFFDKRWPLVRDIPAVVRFCSYEPALGPLQLHPDCREGLHWVIFGGETTRCRDASRPCDPEWARSMRDQCHEKEINFFFKQWGNDLPLADGGRKWTGKTADFYREHHDKLDRREWKQIPTPRLVINH